jgi:hypothetical protein
VTYKELIEQQRQERALLIERAMLDSHWQLWTAAQKLGMHPSPLRRMLSRAAKNHPESLMARLHHTYRRRCKKPGMPPRKKTNNV